MQYGIKSASIVYSLFQPENAFFGNAVFDSLLCICRTVWQDKDQSFNRVLDIKTNVVQLICFQRPNINELVNVRNTHVVHQTREYLRIGFQRNEVFFSRTPFQVTGTWSWNINLDEIR